ncbi:hypothetical protein J6590_042310 [Homalodisca vitripennis]|nr:hypothetical protein J6590_042310 [Homalodisca vitripennis]
MDRQVPRKLESDSPTGKPTLPDHHGLRERASLTREQERDLGYRFGIFLAILKAAGVRGVLLGIYRSFLTDGRSESKSGRA